MDKETFDVLLELASLPPASFTSSETPISKLFLQKRSTTGSWIPRIPLVAWAIVLKEPLLPSSTSFVPQEKELLRNQARMREKERSSESFVAQNALEKWLCYFAEKRAESRKKFGNYESGMKLWKAIHESDLDDITATTLWLRYFFIFAASTEEVSRMFPGYCQSRLSTEKMVILAMNDIEGKPNWQQNLHDEVIVKKWRTECYEQGFTSSMFDWMMDALHFKAKSKEANTGIQMSPPPCVFHSDSLINENLHVSLNQGFCELLKIDQRFYDWHPGSKQMVLHLVHPSMYCLALGRTHLVEVSDDHTDPLALAREFLSWYKGSQSYQESILFNNQKKMFRSKGSIAAQPVWITTRDKPHLQLPHNIADEVVDHQYQWLPADIRVDSNGKASILSYINSLKESAFYAPLEDLVSAFIPMFERVLTFQVDGYLENHVHGPGYLEHFDLDDFQRSSLDNLYDLKSVEEFREWKKERLEEGKEIPPCPLPEFEDDEELAEQRHWHSVRTFVPPRVRQFEAPNLEKVEWIELQDKTIQIIFKLASIELTPENPEYEGSVWHVEGTYAEVICATGIYYLDSENITDPTLQFRQKIEPNALLTEWDDEEQSQYETMNKLYGHVLDGEDSVQSMYVQLGHISTPSQRSIVFPNSMHYKLSPFKLIDPSKSGHRRMIVMFLLNPDCRIISSAEVFQQQCNEREAAFAFGTTVDQLPYIKLGNLSFDVSNLILQEVLGKSKEAFELFKKITRSRKEENDDEDDWQLESHRDFRDARIRFGSGTEEEIEEQKRERHREVVKFSAPMTYEEACWHRARLMQQRNKIIKNYWQEDDESVREDDGFGWSLCEH